MQLILWISHLRKIYGDEILKKQEKRFSIDLTFSLSLAAESCWPGPRTRILWKVALESPVLLIHFVLNDTLPCDFVF
jgi:hypothetical protein